MKKFLILNKKEGETPLECLESFRAKHKVYKDVKMTYAGRLDPLVSGLLVILAGDLVHQKEKYLKLSKEYEFEVLFGFATDTHDILGKVISKPLRQDLSGNENLEKKIKKNLKYFRGKFIQKYPLYSSKTIKQARAGLEVEESEHEVRVFRLKFLKLKKINNKQLLSNIEKRIKKVQGDFRQKEILKIWRKNLIKKSQSFSIGSFRIKCSSGTYVRAIANDLGMHMKIPALALKIKRTQIGKWSQPE